MNCSIQKVETAVRGVTPDFTPSPSDGLHGHFSMLCITPCSKTKNIYGKFAYLLKRTQINKCIRRSIQKLQAFASSVNFKQIRREIIEFIFMKHIKPVVVCAPMAKRVSINILWLRVFTTLL